MRKQSVGRTRSISEALETRRLLTSAGTLLTYDFNAGTQWPSVAASSSAGVVASAAQSNVGTIDVENTSDQTGAVALTVTSGQSGGWTSDLASGKLAVTNTETNLGKLTLGFSLAASQVKGVKVIITSYDSAGNRSGALSTVVEPAAVNSFQRFSVDLSTCMASGTGTFVANAPYVSFNFEMGGALGWTNATSTQLRVDNLQYAKPAYYVSSIDGNNNDNGKTEAAAFLTIQKALDVAQPGDMILVKGDTAHPYTVSAGNRNYVRTGGTPAEWVSLRSYPGQSPMIYTEGWAAIQVGASSASTAPAIAYVEIRGLHVKGDSLKVGTRSAPDGAYDPTAPNADQYGPYAKYIQPVDPTTGKALPSPAGTGADSRTNGNGISVDGGNELNKPHDIRIADNLVEQCAGGGIGAGSADRVQFEDNVSRDNCYWDKYASSGMGVLSTYQFEADGPNTANTVTRLFRNNISSGNIHKEEWVRDSPTLTQYSDGNGIIIDFNHNSSGTVLARTLVTNNVVFDNGGSGIHSYNSDHVDIVNNVAYLNSSSPYLQYGEIFSQGNDTRIYNNILVAPVAATGQPKEQVNGGTKPTSTNKIVYRNNVYFGGNTAGWAADAFNIGNVTADPKFVNATVNSALADFHLQSSSPAINLGTTALAPALDITDTLRYGNPDSGAYEFIPPAPTAISLAPVSDTGTAGDNKTRLNNASAATKLSFVVTGTVSGATVQLFDNGTLVGTATAGGTTTTVTTDGQTALPGGVSAVTAQQTFAGAPSAVSAALSVTVDISSPTLIGTPVINANLGAGYAATRSLIRTISWTFSEPVLAGLGNFALTNLTTGQSVDLSSRAVTVSGNVVTLTLDQTTDVYPGLFLANGNYRLTLAATVTDTAGNALDADGNGTPGDSATFDFFKLLADVNGDRSVNFSDFLLLQSAFGSVAGSGSFNAGCDFDGNGVINFSDFLVLQSAFGNSIPAAAVKPAIRYVR